MTQAPPELQAVFNHIDAHRDRAIADLQRLVRQPSVSAQNIGLEACAELVVELMREEGIEARAYPLEGGPPCVIGLAPSERSGKTLLAYAHYDVQPVEPVELWTHPPYGAELADGRLWGRGATDNKSGVLAFIKAAAAWRAAGGGMPANVKFITEGEEEIGSIHLGPFIEANPELVRADAMHCLDGGVHPSAMVPDIDLGLKSVLFVELVARGAKSDIHSLNAPLVPQPAWDLVRALNTLVDANRRVLIDGWYDELIPPDEDDLRHLREELAHFDRAELARQLGASRDFPFDDTLELLKAIHYGASCNINGLSAGYTGQGSKTIVPAEAMARLDFRCPPNLEPAEQLKKLEAHLRKHGFDDIELAVHTARANPYKTPVREAISQAVIGAADRIWGEPPLVMGVSTQGTIMIHVPHPAVLSGFGAPENNLHAPNENMPIERYIQGIKFAATIFQEFADRTRG